MEEHVTEGGGGYGPERPRGPFAQVKTKKVPQRIVIISGLFKLPRTGGTRKLPMQSKRGVRANTMVVPAREESKKSSR